MSNADSRAGESSSARVFRRPSLAGVAPGLATLLHYPRSFLRFDLVAGVTVGAVAVPSSLAMAELAGLPVVYGLYGTFLPLAVYGLLGYVAAARDRARLHAGRVDGGDGGADGDGRG